MSAMTVQFVKENYLNLETFRRNGQGVKTPVWFVEDAGRLYTRTLASSGKVKRLRNSGRVRVAPCEASGTLRGDWLEAEARILADAASGQQVNRLMNRKYGFLKRLFDLRQLLSRNEMAVIEITLPEK